MNHKILALVFLTLMPSLAYGDSIVGSKHDLSDSSMDPNSDQPCVFCHTPHQADPTVGPLWNRFLEGSIAFTIYTSSTMNTVCTNPPSTITLACMSCHDGVIAPAGKKHDLRNAPGPGGMPDTSSWPKCAGCHQNPDGTGPPRFGITVVGTDLTNDHPVSMTFPTPLQDPGFFIPPDLTKGWPDLPLYNGKVECSSCHNVHDPAIVPFMRISNNNSALCYRCHNK